MILPKRNQLGGARPSCRVPGRRGARPPSRTSAPVRRTGSAHRFVALDSAGAGSAHRVRPVVSHRGNDSAVVHRVRTARRRPLPAPVDIVPHAVNEPGIAILRGPLAAPFEIVSGTLRRSAPRRLQPDLRSGQPRGHRAVPPRVDRVQQPAAVARNGVAVHQARLLQQSELTRQRGSTDRQRCSESRRSLRSQREGGDDPPSRRVGQEGDPKSVPPRHRPIMSGSAHRTLTQASHGRRG